MADDRSQSTVVMQLTDADFMVRALELLKRVEDALYDQIDEDHPSCGWGPLYQEIADFLDSINLNAQEEKR